MKKILITGATGFVGSHLTELCMEKGYDVVDVRHGAEAALSLREQVADLILMDN